jgi:predicted acylesterase/phospholipase RssA
MSEEEYDTMVLSAGGIKGLFLLGGIQAVIDNNLCKKIDKYVGTSVGCILGYLLAIGYTPIEIMVSFYTNHWLEKMQSFNLVSMINGNGATSFTPLHEALEKMTLQKIGRFLTLGKLREIYGKTLICVTYNMTVCMTEYIGPDNYPDLPCLTALRMSSNLPLIFDRFKYMDNYYIDGAFSDNFPILKGQEIGKKVLGIFVKINEKSLQDDPEDGIITYFLRLLQIPMAQSTKDKNNLATEKCDLIGIDTDMRNFVDFDIKSKMRLDMFSKGYENVKNYLKNKSI